MYPVPIHDAPTSPKFSFGLDHTYYGSLGLSVVIIRMVYAVYPYLHKILKLRVYFVSSLFLFNSFEGGRKKEIKEKELCR